MIELSIHSYFLYHNFKKFIRILKYVYLEGVEEDLEHEEKRENCEHRYREDSSAKNISSKKIYPY